MSDWIEWNGGECPVDSQTMVEIRFRSSDDIYKALAGDYYWGPLADGAPITAYRIAEPEQDPSPDMVNHPPHYTAGGIECIEAIRAALTPDEFRGHCKANAMKYIWREAHKGQDESIRKAIWYLEEMLK
jgi:hypothetical protein